MQEVAGGDDPARPEAAAAHNMGVKDGAAMADGSAAVTGAGVLSFETCGDFANQRIAAIMGFTASYEFSSFAKDVYKGFSDMQEIFLLSMLMNLSLPGHRRSLLQFGRKSRTRPRREHVVSELTVRL